MSIQLRPRTSLVSAASGLGVSKSLAVLVLSAYLCLALAAAVCADTTPPTIDSIVITPSIAAGEDSLHVTVTATDDVGVTTVTADSVELAATGADTWEGDISANSALGDHGVTVIATDAESNFTTDTSGHYRTLPVVGINSNTALSSLANVASSDYLFKVWGRASFMDEDHLQTD